jgi:ankyrin repeat protein
MIQLLLAHGATVYDQEGNSLARLRGQRKKLNAAFFRCPYSDLATRLILIYLGMDPNARDEAGSTPLMSARSRDFAKALVDRGADVNAKNKHGETPLLTVSGAETIQFILDKGARPDEGRKNGCTALFFACQDGDLKIIRALLAKGANIEASDGGDHRTPLMAAASEGHVDAMRFLLEHGAKLEAKDDGGNTALVWAARSGDVPSVKLLLDRGADVNVRDRDGETLLQLVAQTSSPGRFDVLTLLRQSGARD